jgi:hypothetical protein
VTGAATGWLDAVERIVYDVFVIVDKLIVINAGAIGVVWSVLCDQVMVCNLI